MAAQRFGGKYSPDGSRQAGTQPPIPRASPGSEKPKGGWRASFLFFSAFIFLFPAFGEEPGAMLLSLIAGGCLILAAWLSREGLRARAAFDARRVAQRPAIPRLLFGAIATGAALFTGGLIGHGISLYPILFALAGAGLHIGAFGLDPWSDKGMEGIDRFQTDRVARAVAGAEKTLSQMKDAILRAKDRQLEGRVDRFIAQTRGLMQRVEEDPGDLTAARRYLTVYLEGARDATVKFADLWAIRPDPKARADYEALLTDLETTFATRSENLLGNDRDNLDVEISVLRDRLKFETPSGISSGTPPGSNPPQV